MEVWIVSGLLLGGVLAFFAFALWFYGWDRRRKLRRRDARRHAEQRELLRKMRTGQPIPARVETVYAPGELVDEDAARMAELGYEIADEVGYGDGRRKLVYRLPGVSAL